MRIKLLLGATAALLLAGCSATNTLTSAGSQVQITDTQPGSECQLLGTVTGVQNNGYQALVLKANHYVVLLMIYATKQPLWVVMLFLMLVQVQVALSIAFAPLDSKMSGQVYKCQ